MLIAVLLGDRYRVERELGQGGMATVYLARDLKHDRPVAIKVLRPELALGLGPDRFLQEIRLTASLQHPHLLPLIDSGETVLSRESWVVGREAAPEEPTTHDSRPMSFLYYVMPFVEGESLRRRLERERQLPVDEAVRIAFEVASALAYAHARGVVHRDIKPENILLSAGQAVVADFGIARALSAAADERLTETGLVMGTPRYMSPEQATGERSIGPPTDVYALGCVLYEMLAGEAPFTGPTAAAVIARRLHEPVPRVREVRDTVPETVERTIVRALARVPADRFPTGAEFAAALAHPMPAAAAGARPVGRGVPRWAAASLLAGVLVAGGAALWLRSRGPAIIPSASLIAVLPFEPSGPDTALARLGRDLVFTLSAAIDGLGGIRVADPHSVLARARAAGPSTAAEATALARRFGAGSVVRGSAVREGPNVRLDFVLLPTGGSGEPVARGSVAGLPDSVASLTDSVAHVLLRQVWARGSPPTPSLDAALRTRSAAGLRAFLQGEGEIAGGQWDSAAVSYERAMSADPRFWLAYARHVYARTWSLQEPAESVMQTLAVHRSELPERERLSVEAIMLLATDSGAAALERARQAAERYSDSWFGWLLYGDQLLHTGPLLGHERTESRTAFGRALELNGDLIPAWEHLLLLAALDRDTAALATGIHALGRLHAWPSLTADGYGDRRLQFTFLDAVTRGDSALVGVLADSMAHDVAGSFYDPFLYGYFADQIRVSTGALRLGTPPRTESVHRRLIALSWAGRGAWDSAVVAMDRLAASGLDPRGALESYGMAAVGVWLGALDPAEAQARRPAAAQAAGDGSARAELAWLDGVAAASRRDQGGLAGARAALRASGDSATAALDRSLGAFDAALRGEVRKAGNAMATLEWEQAAVLAPAYRGHPFTLAVNRLAGGRWLAEAGDTSGALRLLGWVEGPYLLHPGTEYGTMLTGLVDLERARLEARSGRTDRAGVHYREFLRRYDRPPAAHQALVEEARTALRSRTSRRAGGAGRARARSG